VTGGAAPAESRATAATAPPNVSESAQLAVDRTRLAHERTLMAWVRTATSMISFGFTIAKLVPNRENGRESWLFDTHTFASIMIGIALVALTFAAIQHRREMRTLRARYPGHVPYSNAMFVASLVAGFGILAFVGVLIGR
jgi:inner membrane protein YidH